MGFGSIRQPADRFMISLHPVHSYIKRHRETQDLTLKNTGSTRPGKLEAHQDENCFYGARTPGFDSATVLPASITRVKYLCQFRGYV